MTTVRPDCQHGLLQWNFSLPKTAKTLTVILVLVLEKNSLEPQKGVPSAQQNVADNSIDEEYSQI